MCKPFTKPTHLYSSEPINGILIITDPTSIIIDAHGSCKEEGTFVAHNPVHGNPYKYGFEYNMDSSIYIACQTRLVKGAGILI